MRIVDVVVLRLSTILFIDLFRAATGVERLL